MKILILGATGRTGRHLLNEALQKGHTVHALVRDKTRLQHSSPDLVLFEGSPTDVSSLSRAARGCDAILSTLNISRNSDFPWSGLRTPPNFLSEVMRKLINIAKDERIKRLVICSAWGVNETKKDLPAWFRWMIDNSNIGIAYRDHEKQELMLRQTYFDYTIVRPVGLTNSSKTRGVQVSFNNDPKPKWTIARRDVARFMLESAETGNYIRLLPTISN